MATGEIAFVGSSQHDGSMPDIVRPEHPSDWESLLEQRANEARDCERDATNEDKRLIKLYLPLLLQKDTQNTPSKSITVCQWRPPKTLNKEHAAQIISQHLFGHLNTVPFTDVVEEAACPSKPKSTEVLKACAKCIYDDYQSSKRLRDEYASVRDVGFYLLE
jgi:hypothetical protein